MKWSVVEWSSGAGSSQPVGQQWRWWCRVNFFRVFPCTLAGCAVLCCAVLCCAVLCCAVWCCCAVPLLLHFLLLLLVLTGWSGWAAAVLLEDFSFWVSLLLAWPVLRGLQWCGAFFSLLAAELAGWWWWCCSVSRRLAVGVAGGDRTLQFFLFWAPCCWPGS